MKTIVITGTSTGFGFLAAKRLAGRGDRVFATMRDPEGKNSRPAGELRSFTSQGGGAIEVLDLDVTSDESVEAAAKVILDAAGAPDVVINNAGQMYVGLAEAFTPDEFTRQLDVNVVGIQRVCRAFLPAMRERGSGLIINLSSIAGRIATPFFAVYNASKWAVEGYSLGIRGELATSGVDVVVVEPGPFSTELFPQSPRPKDEDGRAASYPKLVHQTFEAMGSMFEGMFKDPDVPTDPAHVVDRFVELIDMEPGKRPFRSVVGVDMGVRGRNATVEQHEEELIRMMEFDEFVRLRTS